MSDNDLPLNERFTLFFDFLGSSAATSWPKERLYQFLDLLMENNDDPLLTYERGVWLFLIVVSPQPFLA